MFESIFGKSHNVLIGAVHLPPLPGYPDFPGFDVAIENALQDVKALQEGGATAIIFENNYDVPHTAHITEEQTLAMIRIGSEIKAAIHVPLGVSVLWNDYRAALRIAKELDLQFVRIPVFVDRVETAYGIMDGVAAEATKLRTALNAESVALCTDIHVKHAKLLVDESIEKTALRAIEAGSDALIITGQWTGDAPDTNDLQRVQLAVGAFPILIGSGVDKKNIKELFRYVTGAIVSTSLKEDSSEVHEMNVKPYGIRISTQKTKDLFTAVADS